MNLNLNVHTFIIESFENNGRLLCKTTCNIYASSSPMAECKIVLVNSPSSSPANPRLLSLTLYVRSPNAK